MGQPHNGRAESSPSCRGGRTAPASCWLRVGCVAVGTALGLALTYGVVTDDDGIGAARVGPWPSGPMPADPISTRISAPALPSSGEIPLASAEGLSIVAREDDGGQPLRRQCSYRIAGGMPDAQFWTIEATSETGAPLDNPAHRFSFTAADILPRRSRTRGHRSRTPGAAWKLAAAGRRTVGSSWFCVSTAHRPPQVAPRADST